MIFGWLTSRRFFNELAMAGLANPGQWTSGLGLSVTMSFKTLLRQTKILSNILFCVSDIPRIKYMFLDQSKTNAKNQRILNSQARGLLCISDG